MTVGGNDPGVVLEDMLDVRGDGPVDDAKQVGCIDRSLGDPTSMIRSLDRGVGRLRPQPRHVVSGDGMVSPCLVSERNDPSIDGTEPEGTVLATGSHEGQPLRGRARAKLRRREVSDTHADEGGRAVAKTGFDPSSRCDVDALVVGDEHELARTIGEGGILVPRPSPDDLKGGRSNLVGRGGSLPASLGRSPGGKQLSDRIGCDGGSFGDDGLPMPPRSIMAHCRPGAQGLVGSVAELVLLVASGDAVVLDK